MNKKPHFIFIVIFGALSLVLVVGFYFQELKNVRSEGTTVWTEDLNADCAVVLTGGRGRVKDGFSLLSRRAIRKLIISGVYEKSSLREILPEWPYYGDLDPSDVVLEKYSQTTYGNALQTYTVVSALKCQDLVLITSQSHMYRAYKTFQAQFPKDFILIKRAVLSDSSEEYVEAMKSLFYSAWAY